jgi:hypothetical protein
VRLVYLFVIIGFFCASYEMTNLAWADCPPGTSSPNTVPNAPTIANLQYNPPSVTMLLRPTGQGSLTQACPAFQSYYVTRSVGTGPFIEQPFIPNLVAYWKFDGQITGLKNYGSFASSDLNTGGTFNTANDFDSSTGQIATAAKFRGTSWLTVQTQSPYNFGSSFSVSLWIKGNQISPQYSSVGLITKVNGGSFTGQGWAVWLQGYTGTRGIIYFNIDSSDSSKAMVGNLANILDGQWHHIVVTYDSSVGGAAGMKIYVAGDSSGTYQVYNNLSGSTSNSNPVTIGAVSTTNSNAFTGEMDDMRIYNAPLSQTQVILLRDLSLAGAFSASGDASTFTDPSPGAGAQNCYVAFAENVTMGQGPGSSQVCTPTTSGPPGPPTDLTSSSNQLSWTAPSDNGGSSITGYYVTASKDINSGFVEYPFTSSPISYWKFDGPITGLADFGNLANDVRLGGGSLTYDTVNGKIAGALNLDGNSWLTVPNSFNYNFVNPNAASPVCGTPFSISFFMKGNQISPQYSSVGLISKSDGGSFTGKGWDVWLQGYTDTRGIINFNIESADSSTTTAMVGRIANILDGQWHHIAVTYTGGTLPGSGSCTGAAGMKIYVDGDSSGTYQVYNNLSGTTSVNNIPVKIGGLASTSSGYMFKGELDDVRIYNVALNATPQVSGLAGYVRINATTSFTDNSGAGNSIYRTYAVNANGQGMSSNVWMASTVQRSLSFDQPNGYLINHGGLITLKDPTANIKTNAKDVVLVTVTDTSTSSSVQVPLRETSANSGIFDNSANMVVFSSSITNNVIPTLKVNPSDGLQVAYSGLTATSSILSGTLPYSTQGVPTTTFARISCGADGDNDPGSPTGDGICDDWENPAFQSQGNGLHIHGADGVVYALDCTSATPIDTECPNQNQKDVYVQIDWMPGHAPSTSAINAVKSAFIANGIHLHVILGEQLPFHYDFIQWSASSGSGSSYVPSFQDIKSQYFLLPSERTCPTGLTISCDQYLQDIYNAKAQAVHFAVFLHNIDTIGQTGEGILSGPDFAVSLGSFVNSVGSPDDQAGTFMHELGHNLGLDHGGMFTLSDSGTNCKPNYLSVMSYTRQFSSFIFDRPIDYNGAQLPDINEASPLSESIGIGDWHGQGQKTVYGGWKSTGSMFNPSTNVTWANGSPTDFDRDGDHGTGTTVSNTNIHYVNIGGCTDQVARNLKSNVDWTNLQYLFSNSATIDPGVTMDTASVQAAEKETTHNTVKKMRGMLISTLQNEVGKLP